MDPHVFELVEQPEYSTIRPYIIDFVEFHFKIRARQKDKIRELFLEKGLSAAQVADHLGISKTAVIEHLHSFGIRVLSSKDRMTSPKNYRARVAPYGYSVKNGKLVVNKKETRLCRFIVHSVRDKEWSASKTARALIQNGFKNRNGSTYWDHKIVKNIFNRWREKL